MAFPRNNDIEERLREHLSVVLAIKDIMKTPMIKGELPLVPKDLSTSTFMLPVKPVGEEQQYVDAHVDRLLAEEFEWAPPGWKSAETCMQLWPLKNEGGNGHGLFRSVAIALWGCNDEGKTLEMLVEAVLEQHGDLLFSIWKDAHPKATEQTWNAYIAKIPEKDGCSRFYLYILANILRRPIVIICDEFRRDANFSRMDKAGMDSEIFLPTLVEPGDCIETPLVLGLTSGNKVGHASTLAGVCGHLTHVKLFDKNGIHFSFRYGKRDGWQKDLSKYMSMEKYGADGTASFNGG